MKYPPCDLIEYRRNIYLGYSTVYLATLSLKWDVLCVCFFQVCYSAIAKKEFFNLCIL